MALYRQILLFILAFVLPTLGLASIRVGVEKVEITPVPGTPSAGYTERQGSRMEGVHDPLLAIAIFIDNGEKKVVFCSVDHLGFTHEMVESITQKVKSQPQLGECEVYIGSSHTHSGGGAYLNIPYLGESLAGPYSPEVTNFYIDETACAIIKASQNTVLAKVGFGYGKAGELSRYRGLWPKDISPLKDVAVIKVTDLEDRPLAVVFNYPVHPTVLRSQNRLFSADFVGYARKHLQFILGSTVQPLYFNGAQGEIIPVIFNEEDRFDSCDQLAQSLAETVVKVWEVTECTDVLQITSQKKSYVFHPQPTPFGLALPVDSYQSEMNLIVFNGSDAFITIPGELSCIYDQRLKELGRKLGYSHVSILGLTNDAHGYIILPESWEHKTFESGFSFGGKEYGAQIEESARFLLEANAPY